MNPEPQKSGPTTLSPAQIRVAVALAAGQSITAAAGETGISRTTVYNWMHNDPEFRSKYKIILQNLEDELVDQVLELRLMAMAKLRALFDDPETPVAIQLRAALAVLKETLKTSIPDKIQEFSTDEAAGGAITLDKTEHFSAPRKTAVGRTVLDKSEQNPTPAAVGRNTPCPCGSGAKYKRCCGHNAPPLLNVA